MDDIKLICFDLDETLITHTSWKELGLALGVSYEEDAKFFNEYNSGNITYQEWNNKIIELYMRHDNATREGVTQILSQYTYRDGVRETINYLREKGYELVIISGSIDILVNMIAKDLNIKYAKANNTFIFDEDGRLQAAHSDGTDEIFQKQAYLESFCELLGIPIEQCACIADGANDIEMFRKTRHGITFKDSQIEHEAWKIINSFSDLKNIF